MHILEYVNKNNLKLYLKYIKKIFLIFGALFICIIDKLYLA